ncbi:MAG: hypothetical protein AAFY35_16525 [Pseudomonadota bacterium]
MTNQNTGIQEVQMPDGTIREFPRNMADSDIERVIREQYYGNAQTPAKAQREGGDPEVDALIRELEGHSSGGDAMQAALAERERRKHMQAAHVELAKRKLAEKRQQPQTERTLGHRIYDNIIGDPNDGVMSTGEKVGTFLNRAGESLTLGLVGDEASAWYDANVPNGLKPLPLRFGGGSYEERRDHYREQQDQLQQENPVASVAADLLPIVIPGAGIANTAVRTGNMARAIPQGAAVAGTQAGLLGFMEGENSFDERLSEGAESGLLGLLGGAALTPVIRGAQRLADSRATKAAMKPILAATRSVDDLQNEASGLYAAGRARGTILSPEDGRNLANDVRTALKDEGVMRSTGSLITRDPDAKRILDELDDLAEFGLDGSQVKPIREFFTAAASDTNPARARIGKIMLRKFDDAVARNAPEFAEGDKIYGRAKRLRELDQMVDLADTSDSANALRREFQKADRKQIRGQSRGMSEGDIEAMQRVARGTPFERSARKVGSLAPSSLSGAMFNGAPPIVAAAMAGNPALGMAVAGGMMGTGLLGRLAAKSAQRGNLDAARAAISTGQRLPQVQSRHHDSIAGGLLGLIGRGAGSY